MESIGLDLDGVLYPWVSAVCTYFRLYEGYEGSDYEFSRRVYEILPEEKAAYMATIPDLYYKFIPTSKMMSLLNKLSNKFYIHYVTSRPEEAITVTEKYLRDFNFPQKENLEFSKDKDVYAKYQNLQYFVEDNIRNAEKLNKICLTFLVRTPYNEDYTGDVKMIDSIYDLERILL